MSAAEVKSRVSPAGTAMLSRTIVAHDFAEALAAEAAVKVQEVALLSKATGAGAAVTAGSAAGAAATSASREANAVIFATIVLV